MSAFVIVNWSACILSSFILIIVFSRARFLFVKPSIAVLVFFHVMCQWSATIDSDNIEAFLPHPYDFFILVHGFVLLGLFMSLFTARKSALIVWKRIIDAGYLSKGIGYRGILIVSSLISIIVVYYLLNVPFHKTGLYAIFTASDYVAAAIAREESLATLDNIFLQYLYNFMRSSFGPLLVAMLTLVIRQGIIDKHIVKIILGIIGIVIIMFMVTLTGARAYIGNMLIVMSLVYLFRRRLRVSPLVVIIGFIMILMPAVILTIGREGEVINLENIIVYFMSGTLSRVFVTPMNVGLWHVHYAQTTGYIGIAGIPKLASFLGVEPIDVANLVGLQYVVGALESVTANTSYIFSYYSYFGIIAFPFCLLGLLILDLAVLLYRKLGDNVLLPAVCVICIESMTFVATNYTIALFTHGFALTLLTCFLIDRNIVDLRSRNIKIIEPS